MLKEWEICARSSFTSCGDDFLTIGTNFKKKSGPSLFSMGKVIC
jgi:hypothetical protein